MKKVILLLTLFATLISVNCGKNPTENEKASQNTVTDIDGNIYSIVKIGDQIWMAENLKVTKYRNGTLIPHVTDNSEWTGLTTGAYCIYNNDKSNVATYGNLYNWYAINDTRNIAPTGWHISSDDEWKQLEMALGMSESNAYDTFWRGTSEGSKLAGKADLWSNGELENNAGFGKSGFFALPGGFRSYSNGTFNYIRTRAYFWSSTVYNENVIAAWIRGLRYDHSDETRDYGHKRNGFSVRCLQD